MNGSRKHGRFFVMCSLSTKSMNRIGVSLWEPVNALTDFTGVIKN